MPDLSLTRDGLAIGGVLLRWYGLIVVSAALIGILLAARLAKRAGSAPEHAWRAALWALPLGWPVRGCGMCSSHLKRRSRLAAPANGCSPTCST